MTKFHGIFQQLVGIFQQLVGNVSDRILNLYLSLSRVPLLARKKSTEVVGEKIG